MNTKVYEQVEKIAVIIKDMNMPSNCKECELEVVVPLDGLIICGYTKRNNKSHHIFDRTKERRPDCPLVEFPTKHNQDNEDVTEQQYTEMGM